MKLRCWDPKNHNEVVDYLIPSTVEINPHNPIFEQVDFYKKDVKAHAKQVNAEIWETWKICRTNGVPKDLTRHIIKNYIKRPVKYGTHVKENPPPPAFIQDGWDVFLLVLVIIMITIITVLVVLLFLKQEEHKPKITNSNNVAGPAGPRGWPGPAGPPGACSSRGPSWVCTQKEGEPPSCKLE